MNYIIVAILCIVPLAIAIVSLVENELISRSRKDKFIILALVIIGEILIDAVSLYMDGKGKVEVNKLLKILEFMVVPFIPAILSNLVAQEKFWKKIKPVFMVAIGFNVVAQIVTFFVPLMFSIDENAIYSRTTFTYLYAGIVIFSFIMLIVTSNNTFIQNSTIVSPTLLSINIFLIMGMVIRWFDIKSNWDWLCLTIGFLLFMIFYDNSFLKIDSMTSLLNRSAFDTRISRITYNTAFILIDANDFKNINDTYGHHCGDFALAKIASAIFTVYSRIGYCYRVGGDEFCVILKPRVLKALTYKTENYDTYAMLKKLIHDLDDLLEEMSKKYHFLSKGVSQGYGIYYTPSNLPTDVEYKTIEEVMKYADNWMYRKKEVKKSEETS